MPSAKFRILIGISSFLERLQVGGRAFRRILAVSIRISSACTSGSVLMAAYVLAMLSSVCKYLEVIAKLPPFANTAVSSSVRTRSVRLMTSLDFSVVRELVSSATSHI